MKILIKGGRVINPATQMDETNDVFLKDGLVAKIGKDLKDSADHVIDARGCYVMPGFIDMHVHLRDPGFEEKEDIFSGMRAAARGGYTTIYAMPNTKPVVDSPDVVEYVYHKAGSGKCVHVYQVGAITEGQEGKKLADIAGMVKAGAPAISEDGKSVMNAQLYLEAMKIAAELDIPVLAHCEDMNMARGGVMNEGAKSEEFGLQGISNASEDVIIARDIILARESGARLHLCHCSTREAPTLVATAKQQGIRVTAEVCPHHFTLTADDIPEYEQEIVNGIRIPQDTDADPNYKMNPPLRCSEDREALRNGLKSGAIDVISTDHAPHTFADKNTSMKRAPFGIVGLETAACLTYTELVLGGYLTPMQMAEKMSYNAARIMKLDKGDIQPGKAADIVIFDPKETYAIDKNQFASKGRNTPFHGRTVTGRVRMTICDGEIVYEG